MGITKNDAFPSKWVAAADLQGREVKVVISDVQMEEVGDGHKPVCYFQNREKGLVLNVTNFNTIAEMYGDDTDGWVDQPVTLFPTYTSFQGKQVPCVRVKPQMQPRRPAAAQSRQNGAPQHDERNPPPPTTAPRGDLDDEIPF